MKKITYYTNIFLYLFAITSCKKFVTIDSPKTQLVTEKVFQDNETATSALINIYTSMMDIGRVSYSIPVYTGLSGDELKNYFGAATYQQLYINNMNSTDAQTNDIWSNAYNYIYQANAVIEGCQQSASITTAVKKQLVAEAFFIRAFWHFYLVNLYGDIPIVTTTDYTLNSVAGKAQKATVYTQIIKDLKKAEADLNENYVALNSVDLTVERIRPNKYTATAMLARVYLFTEEFTLAESEASLVINNTSTYELTTLDNVFLKNSKEAIWQWMKPTPNSTSINTPEGSGFILTNKPTNGVSLSPSMANSFEEADQRKIKWIGKYTDATVTPNIDYYYAYKYKVKTGSDITEYSMIFRLAEQYLIRAEARAEQNNLTSAIEDVDKIRNRASLPLLKNINPTITKNNLLAVILQERKSELFTECGHRWLDLKRTGNIDSVMTAYSSIKGSTWNTNKQLWPIPYKDIQNNYNLIQNLSYN